ncbi:Hsp20/alpha crystallin family protein [Halorussus salilacus]|uniref:Hsp20/alpha crystallin family protein n=1 Tax=Halorussus salilacus TaxID=2953750 RepID=UPI00209EE23C|nr:Hsp20/alpha crystallin family protein [Halorussus salilacus]USZ66734.1 Hsp20/alpha crystallin family protein [Halorussus salilacus]
MARRRNPFEELEEMIDRMSRQFEESMGGGDWQKGLRVGSGMSVDVADRGDEYVVTADLPGFDTDDMDVSIRDDVLRIEADREEATEEGDEGDEGDEGRYIRRERRHQSVSRSVTLPEGVDEGNVSAEYRNGVLTVTLPKMVEGDDSHHIDIS